MRESNTNHRSARRDHPPAGSPDDQLKDAEPHSAEVEDDFAVPKAEEQIANLEKATYRALEAEDRLLQAERRIAEQLERLLQVMGRGGGDAPSEDTAPTAKEPTPKTSPGVDATLQQAAASASLTGRLDLGQIGGRIATADIAASVESFHSSASVLDSMQMRYPMVHLPPSWAPLDLGNSVLSPTRLSHPGSRAAASPSEIIDLARQAPQEAKRAGLRFNTMPVSQARQSFAGLLVNFLKTRVQAALGSPNSDDPGGLRPGTPDLLGLDVTEHTNVPRLRIYYAPVYFPATRLVFGRDLSTPVRGYLSPGIYMFGAEGQNVPLAFEVDTFWSIPPDFTINMLKP
jgi:hypothetical protein